MTFFSSKLHEAVELGILEFRPGIQVENGFAC